MQNKPKVVNIAFQTKILRKAETRCSQVNDAYEKDNEQDASMQGFMKSKESTKLMYELLNIIKATPLSIQEIVKNSIASKLSSSASSSQSSQLFTENINNENDQQLQKIVFPEKLSSQNQQTVQNQLQTLQNQPSIDQQISKTNTIYIPKDQTDSINENNLLGRQKGQKHFSIFSTIKNNHKSNIKENNQKNTLYTRQSTFYLIPSKYQQNLQFLLTHFLKFKLINTSQNSMKMSTITKRPKTTSKNLKNNQKTQKFTSPTNKPSTAISQSRTLNFKQKLASPSNLAQDFNEHFQRIIQMQKQIQKKSRRIIFLQNQLLSCAQTIKDKNSQIKQLQQKQICLKKKFSYEFDKIMKGKVMTDINELFLSNLNQQNNYGKSIFQINGKKYVKSNQIPCHTQSTFITSPKMSMFCRTNQSIFQSFDKPQVDPLKKSQSTALFRKSKGVSKKLQIMKLNKLTQSLQKQVQKMERQKSQMFDKLSENNAQIQKYIEKIQYELESKKCQISKFSQEIQKLKQI